MFRHFIEGVIGVGHHSSNAAATTTAPAETTTARTAATATIRRWDISQTVPRLAPAPSRSWLRARTPEAMVARQPSPDQGLSPPWLFPSNRTPTKAAASRASAPEAASAISCPRNSPVYYYYDLTKQILDNPLMGLPEDSTTACRASRMPRGGL